MAKARSRSQAGETKKDLILQTALGCFMELGPARTSIAEIAKRAKVPPPLVHYYFPTSESLLIESVQALLDHLRENVVEAVQEVTDDPRKLMTAYLRAHFNWARDNRERFSLWLYFYYESCLNPVFAEMNARIRAVGRSRVSAIIYEGLAKKRFKLPRDADVNELSLEIQSIVTGAWVLPFTESGNDFKQVTELSVKRVLSILGA